MCLLTVDKCKQRNIDSPLSWQSASLHRHTQKSSLKLYCHTKSNFSTDVVISRLRQGTIPILHKLEASSLKKKKHQKEYCVDHYFSPMSVKNTPEAYGVSHQPHHLLCVLPPQPSQMSQSTHTFVKLEKLLDHSKQMLQQKEIFFGGWEKEISN